jgi:hypothetical protein
MEPPAAAAMMHEDGSVEIWAATQAPQSVQGTVANLLGIDKTQVKVHVTLLGGAFGRKSKADFSAEAAWLAKKTGKPVKVSWSREDDIRHGYYHSVSAQYLKGALDEEGNTTAWLHRSVFPSIGSTFSAEATGPGIFELELGMIDNPFAIPNMRLESGDAKAHVRMSATSTMPLLSAVSPTNWRTRPVPILATTCCVSPAHRGRSILWTTAWSIRITVSRWTSTRSTLRGTRQWSRRYRRWLAGAGHCRTVMASVSPCTARS